MSETERTAALRLMTRPWALLCLALLVATAIYTSGLDGGFLFDDFPNIVDNPGVQPHDASFTSLLNAALSSPSSEFKRPLASLSFAANYLATGLDPFWMKLTNLVIHLLNGLLVFVLTRQLVEIVRDAPAGNRRDGIAAALTAGAWMLLPINVTGVLYVVQRMESMANVFVLLGLVGYVAARRTMRSEALAGRGGLRGVLLCGASLVVPTVVGLTAKETAVMLPFYALLVEWIVFDFRTAQTAAPDTPPRFHRRDRRMLMLFALLVLLPLIAGLAWLLPGVLRTGAWATRDFTLGTRLLSEARIVVDYIGWTLLPTPQALSFYHDDFRVSTGLLSPWTTLACILVLLSMCFAVVRLRKQRPLVALGLALFLGCHLLTGTILPLELIYEHRNYFASFGLLLALVPWLARPGNAPAERDGTRTSMARIRWMTLAAFTILWTAETAATAYAWGNPLRLAEDLAARAPRSPRAQYELGRTYIVYSHYDPQSIFTQMAYAPLERSMRLPGSSILPEQALIFMNARMHRALKDAWWDSMITKLAAHKTGVQDESSLAALTKCADDGDCSLPANRMLDAFGAALSHPSPGARLLAIYSDYAWNVLDDRELGLRVAMEAANAKPQEPAYRITLIRMLIVQGRSAEARRQLQRLEQLNIGGRLDETIHALETKLPGA